MKKPVQLSKNIFLIDDHDLGLEERTGTYVLTARDLTLIETSASPSVPYLLNGLSHLGLSGDDVKYIIVTHIHLDHAGGAGAFLEHCPNAQVIVHPKGMRHLADPSRLIAGAKAVYREKFEAHFHPVVPVPNDRLLAKGHGDTLEIDEGCLLTFYDSPGHANHHFSIYHPQANGMFTGDTAGIFYPQLYRKGIELYIPSTSPNQFDPEKMLASISLFRKMNLDCLFFGHYGMSDHPEEAYQQVEDWLERFLQEAQSVFEAKGDLPTQTAVLKNRLFDRLKIFLQARGVQGIDPVLELISLDLEISSMGLIDYLTKKMNGSKP